PTGDGVPTTARERRSIVETFAPPTSITNARRPSRETTIVLGTAQPKLAMRSSRGGTIAMDGLKSGVRRPRPSRSKRSTRLTAPAEARTNVRDGARGSRTAATPAKNAEGLWKRAVTRIERESMTTRSPPAAPEELEMTEYRPSGVIAKPKALPPTATFAPIGSMMRPDGSTAANGELVSGPAG